MKVLLIALLIAIISGILFFFIGAQLAFWISPNVTPDGHVVMPILQLFIGIIAGFGGFVIALIMAYIKIKKRQLRK